MAGITLNKSQVERTWDIAPVIWSRVLDRVFFGDIEGCKDRSQRYFIPFCTTETEHCRYCSVFRCCEERDGTDMRREDIVFGRRYKRDTSLCLILSVKATERRRE